MIAWRLVAGAGLLAVVGWGSGCAGHPKLKADFVGPGNLLRHSTAVSPDPDARSLTRLARPGPATADEGAQNAVPRPAYRVGPQDEVVVIVWGRPDLGSQVPVAMNGQLRASIVQHDGSILLPFLGAVPVGGLTIRQVQQTVEERYGEIVENPQVGVQLRTCRSRSVEFAGAVVRPGLRYLCSELQTLGELLADAGGLAPIADERYGALTRHGVSYTLDYFDAGEDGSLAADILLEDGDMIRFPSVGDRVVHVFGDVRRQGAYPIPVAGMTILGALSRANGLDTVSAASQRIFLVRQTDGMAHTYRIKLSELMTSPEIQVIDGDTLYVATNKLEKWDRWWRKALPFTTVRTDVQVGGE